MLTGKISLALLVAVAAITASAPRALALPAGAAPAPSPSPGIEAVAYRRGFYVVGHVRYYNGYPGALRPRPGYRYYRGYWFPGTAFAAGVAVGRTAAPYPALPPLRLTVAHTRWCESRYRSYRAYDNTWQPYDGPRRQCWSPYS